MSKRCAISRLAVDRTCELHTPDIKYLNCSCQSCGPMRCLLSVWKLEVAKTVRVYPVLQSVRLTNTTMKEFGVVTGMRLAQRFCWWCNSQAYPFASYCAGSAKHLRLDFAIYAVISPKLLTVSSVSHNCFNLMRNNFEMGLDALKYRGIILFDNCR